MIAGVLRPLVAAGCRFCGFTLFCRVDAVEEAPRMKQPRIISAGAGSGKTYWIARTVVEAVRSGAVRPEAILITTFTRKAAGELLDRVSAALIAAGLDEQAVRVRRARIGTVDSICGALVQEHAFAAGLSPRLSVLPEGEEKTLFDRSLSSALEAGDAELRRAAQAPLGRRLPRRRARDRAARARERRRAGRAAGDGRAERCLHLCLNS